MGFMYSWSNIKQVLFSVAKFVAYRYTYTLQETKSTSVFVLGSFDDFCASYRHRRVLLQSFFTPMTPYMYITTGIRTDVYSSCMVLEHQQ